MALRRFKTGLVRSPNPPALRFSAYLRAEALPAVPTVFGQQALIPQKGWGMLLNDELGDCTIAGPQHVEMLWTAVAGSPAAFSDNTARQDYEAACGYVPGDPNTDQGGDMVSVADYWRKTGMIDTHGNRHKIAAYLQINASNLANVDLAAYLFGAVGLGITLPESAEDQFTNGQPWSVTPNSPQMGYHYVPYVGRTADGLRQIVTWGALQAVEESWLKANLEEAVAYVSADYLKSGKSPLGFDLAALTTDLEELS